MPKLSKSQFTVILIVVIIVLVSGLKVYKEFSKGTLRLGVSARAVGSSNAKVKIVEYIDFQCPACAHGYNLLHNIMEDHPGKIYVEIKYFPLGMHRHAFNSARFAECSAKQNKFWPFSKVLFERQSKWKQKLDARIDFRNMAEEVGMDDNQLTDCLQDEKLNESILKEKDKGISLGIKSTPTYFINGSMVVGTKSLQTELKKYIELGDYSNLENQSGHNH